MARGHAGNRRRRALSDHVVRGTLERWRGGPERRTRRLQMARTGWPRRTEDDVRPAGGHPVGLATARGLIPGPLFRAHCLASHALKRHIVRAHAKYLLAAVIVFS